MLLKKNISIVVFVKKTKIGKIKKALFLTKKQRVGHVKWSLVNGVGHVKWALVNTVDALKYKLIFI
jgi:hypothetical protein